MRKSSPPSLPAPRPPARARPAPAQLSLMTVSPKAAVEKPAAAATKAAPKPAAKTTKTAQRGAAEKAERVRAEAALPVASGGALWKMSGKNGVAFVRDAALAGELLGIEPKKLASAAMAVYHDKKGRPFAWQVRFDSARWDEIVRRLT